MTPILDSVNGDIAQITDLLVAAELVNVCKIAAGVNNVNVAILANDVLGLRHIIDRCSGCWAS